MGNSLQPSAGKALSTASTGKLLSELNKAIAIKSNPYTTRIQSSNPTAFIFLIDQSYSMGDMVENGSRSYSKAEAVSENINFLLNELMNRCTKSDFFKHYFDVAVIGYGAKKNKCNHIFEDYQRDRTFVSPQELNDFAKTEEIEEETKIRGKTILKKTSRKYWVKPKASQNTPMIGALNLATEILTEWISCHKSAYPPVVINITDGAQTDGDDDTLLHTAKTLKSLHTEDGHALLFNIHIGNNGTESISFPSRRSEIPDDKYAQLLFDMSSDLPELYHREIAQMKQADNMRAYRAMGYNTLISDFITMLNIGTITNINKNA